MERDTIQSHKRGKATKKPEFKADQVVFKTRIAIDLSELQPGQCGYLAITLIHRHEEGGGFDVDLEECWGSRDFDSFDKGDADEIREVAIFANRQISRGGFISGSGLMGTRRIRDPQDAATQPDNGICKSAEESGA